MFRGVFGYAFGQAAAAAAGLYAASKFEPSGAMAHWWPTAVPEDLYTLKRRKLHETSQIGALNSAGHPFSGGCQVLNFLHKDTEGSANIFTQTCMHKIYQHSLKRSKILQIAESK